MQKHPNCWTKSHRPTYNSNSDCGLYSSVSTVIGQDLHDSVGAEAHTSSELLICDSHERTFGPTLEKHDQRKSQRDTTLQEQCSAAVNNDRLTQKQKNGRKKWKKQQQQKNTKQSTRRSEETHQLWAAHILQGAHQLQTSEKISSTSFLTMAWSIQVKTPKFNKIIL